MHRYDTIFEKPGSSQDSTDETIHNQSIRCPDFDGGFCSRGDSCSFAHIKDGSSETTLHHPLRDPAEKKRRCWHFDRGYCRLGEACNFLHVPRTAGLSITSSASGWEVTTGEHRQTRFGPPNQDVRSTSYGSSLLAEHDKVLWKYLADCTVPQNPSECYKFLSALSKTNRTERVILALASNSFNVRNSFETMVAACRNRDATAKYILDFIHRIHTDLSCRTLCSVEADEVLSDIFDSPQVVQDMVDHLRSSPPEDISSLSWFLERAAIRSSQVRDNPILKEVFLGLTDRNFSNCNLAALTIGSCPEGNIEKLSSIRRTAQCQPGGRHDNDLESFRDIAPMPTTAEVLSITEPFLPTPQMAYPEPSVQIRMNGLDVTNDVLDFHFRYLREDMLGPFRNSFLGISAREWLAEQNFPHNIYNVTVEDIQSFPIPCVTIRVKLPDDHEANKLQTSGERQEYWSSKSARKTLGFQSVFGVLVSGEVSAIARVTFRDSEDLALCDASGRPWPRIGLSIHPEPRQFSEETGDPLLQQLGSPEPPALQIFEIINAYFAYEPYLKSLQRMCHLPLLDALFMAPKSSAERLEYLNHVDLDHALLQMSVEHGLTYDDSQVEAIKLAAASPVSVTQGPPGCGKSRVGATLAKIIVENTPERILCVCFTNHALDDFLQALHNLGISSIGRLGKNYTNEMVAQYLVNNLQLSGDVQRELAKAAKGSLFRARISVLEQKIAKCMDVLQDASNNYISLDSMKTYRVLEDDQIAEILSQIDPDTSIEARKEGSMEDLYWQSWFCRELTVEEGLNSRANLWAAQDKKFQLITEWLDLVRKKARQELVALLENAKLVRREKDLLKQKDWHFRLADKRVIGCTTTGAAQYRDLIQSLNPKVVIVEEAGEVLEAHVLSCLPEACKHLVLIGDHKQLRPKLKNYDLTEQAGIGHRYDISLFQRLVESGKEYGKLSVQHRMRPQISRLLKRTYPNLQDAPSTLQRQPLKGVKSSVLFVNHDEPENSDPEATGRSNPYEAMLVKSIVRYLLQQGYDDRQIVVLTPYSGQLLELREKLSSFSVVELSLADTDDVMNDFALSRKFRQSEDSATLSSRQPKIRISTIDNFQGEEADIVIASLVRCNQEGSIGFMGQPERVNVLLSRARLAEILIGSKGTFMSSKNPNARGLWQDIFEDLKDATFNGFPAVCQQHGRPSSHPLRTEEDFRAFSPHGGCTEPCLESLPCGHICEKMCHPSLGQHMECTYPVAVYCKDGHLNTRKCSGGPLHCPTCSAKAMHKLRLQKDARRKLAVDLERKKGVAEEEARRETEMASAARQLQPQSSQDRWAMFVKRDDERSG